MRLLTMFLIVLVAFLVKYFFEFLSIIASVLIVSIIMLWPSAFVMKLDYDDGRRVSWATQRLLPSKGEGNGGSRTPTTPHARRVPHTGARPRCPSCRGRKN